MSLHFALFKNKFRVNSVLHRQSRYATSSRNTCIDGRNYKEQCYKICKLAAFHLIVPISFRPHWNRPISRGILSLALPPLFKQRNNLMIRIISSIGGKFYLWLLSSWVTALQDLPHSIRSASPTAPRHSNVGWVYIYTGVGNWRQRLVLV